jgi:hypothetical protein
MLKGVHLTLMIGPVVPLPVPKSVLDALTSVQVVSTAGGTASGFELSFTLSNNSPLHTLFLLSGGAMIPIVRVIIIATVNGTPEVLIDGVMLTHDIQPGTAPGQSTLVVKGTDLSVLMTLLPFDGFPFPAMPPAARVLLILAKYAVLGIVPLVIPSILEDFPIPVERIPRQQGNDLAYVQMLAMQAG